MIIRFGLMALQGISDAKKSSFKRLWSRLMAGDRNLKLLLLNAVDVTL